MSISKEAEEMMEELWRHQASRTISYLENICMKGKCWCTK